MTKPFPTIGQRVRDDARTGALEFVAERVRLGGKMAIALAVIAACAGPAPSAGAQTYGPQDDGPAAATPQRETPAVVPDALAKAVSTSLAQSPLALAAIAELAALEADLDAARWQRYPGLTAELLATEGGSNVADTDGLAINLALEQPIWAGGGIDGRIDAARSGRDAGRHALREVRFNIQLAVARAFYDALLSYQRAEMLEAGIERHAALVASIERRVDREVSPLADLTLARSRLTQLEVQLTTARERAEAAMLRLREFVGSEVPSPDTVPVVTAETVPSRGLALERMMTCAPALDRLRSDIDAAEAGVRVARSGLLPQVLLQLSQNEITGARAALVLRLTTGNGLSRLSATESASARVDQAIAELGQADREARTRLASEYVEFEASLARRDAALMAEEAALDLLASYRRQFVAGRRSWLDVLNAAREVTDAEIAHSDASVGAAANASRILALSCQWRPWDV